VRRLRAAGPAGRGIALPRSHARILTKIWSDPDFRGCTAEAQRLYFLAISQPTLSYAGVVPYTPKRWAGFAHNTKIAHVCAAARELAQGRFVVIDEDTEELWVRTYVRHDGMLWIPNSRAAMFREIETIQSEPIGVGFREEYPELFAQPNGHGLAQPLGEPFPEPLLEQLRQRFGQPKRQPKGEGSLA
jgi:hypothetical protein